MILYLCECLGVGVLTVCGRDTLTDLKSASQNKFRPTNRLHAPSVPCSCRSAMLSASTQIRLLVTVGVSAAPVQAP